MALDTLPVLTQAFDLIHEYVRPEGVNLEAIDLRLEALELPYSKRMSIMTRLSALYIKQLTEANNIARSLMAANWEKGIVSREPEDEFADSAIRDLFDGADDLGLSTEEGLDFGKEGPDVEP